MSATRPFSDTGDIGAAVLDILYDTAAAGFGVIDRELRYVRVNRALAAMNGLPEHEHLGRTPRDILPADAADILEPMLRRILDTGERVLDLSVTIADGRRFGASFYPIRDAGGPVTGIAAFVAERSAAEIALRGSEERFRRIAESGIVGLFFWSIDGGITEANDAFLSMLGYTQADLAAGRVDWRRMTPPEYAAADEAAVRELLATGRHGHLAKEYYGRDGRRVPVVVTSAMLDGSLDRGVCVCIDDTARRTAEARLARVLAQVPAAVGVLLGPDHVVYSTNEMFLRLLGRRDYVGRPAREGAPELVEQGFLALMDEVYRTGIPYHGREARLLWDRDGAGSLHEGYFDFVYQPLVDAAGEVEGILVFAVEVTAQVLARRTTERAAGRIERLQSLTAALAGARTVDDVAAVVVAEGMAATGAATAMLALRVPGSDEAVLVRQAGLSPSALQRYTRFSLDAPGPAARCIRTGEPQWVESRDAVLAAYPGIPEIWERLGTQALASVPLHVAGEVVGAVSYTFTSPRRLDDGDRGFFLALGRQAAQAIERARLFEAERAARGEAEAANRAKGEFLAVMSHELRTPLNAIGGYAELIEMGLRGPVTEQQRADLARIQQSQRHLLGLINQVLNYTRVETGTVRYALADVPVTEALVAAEALVAPQVRAKGLTYRLERCDAALHVRADPEKLRQILLNLFGNAVKFTDTGGRVTTSCAATGGGMIAIIVEDTGIGIAPEKLATVFEPFVQVDQQLTRSYEGIGLGLAISRDLARGMGGDITAESTLGAGSRFTLVLPRA